MKIFVKKIFRRKIDKLPVFAELWIFGRNRQMRLEKLPPKFWFSTLYDFWRRGKRDSFNFCPRLSAKLTSTLFVFLLEDTCVPDDKIPEIAWTAHKGGSYLAVTPLLREGGLISRPRGVLMDRHRGDFNSEFQSTFFGKFQYCARAQFFHRVQKGSVIYKTGAIIVCPKKRSKYEVSKYFRKR